LINISRSILTAAKLQTVELRYARGEIVYEHGAPAQLVYAVDEGALYRFRLLSENQRSIRQFLFPGDGFGYEIGRRHRDTVQALKPTKVLAAARGALLAAATSDPGLCNLLFTAAAQAVVVAEDQPVMRRVGVARIAQFLLEMDARIAMRGEINLPMHRRHIADHVGLTLETVCRVLTAFQLEELIKFRDRTQRRLVIRDKKRLQLLVSDSLDFDYLSVLKRKAVNAPTAVSAATAHRADVAAPSFI
jgi:CRP/FNR family transcriptional regulator, nitrogen fixation regulation protein